MKAWETYSYQQPTLHGDSGAAAANRRDDQSCNGMGLTDDQELKATQERIVRFQRWLAQMRQTARIGGIRGCGRRLPSGS